METVERQIRSAFARQDAELLPPPSYGVIAAGIERRQRRRRATAGAGVGVAAVLAGGGALWWQPWVAAGGQDEIIEAAGPDPSDPSRASVTDDGGPTGSQPDGGQPASPDGGEPAVPDNDGPDPDQDTDPGLVDEPLPDEQRWLATIDDQIGRDPDTFFGSYLVDQGLVVVTNPGVDAVSAETALAAPPAGQTLRVEACQRHRSEVETVAEAVTGRSWVDAGSTTSFVISVDARTCTALLRGDPSPTETERLEAEFGDRLTIDRSSSPSRGPAGGDGN